MSSGSARYFECGINCGEGGRERGVEVVEKKLEVQGEMALGFVDLEKAYDTVLREMVMTLRWM